MTPQGRWWRPLPWIGVGFVLALGVSFVRRPGADEIAAGSAAERPAAMADAAASGAEPSPRREPHCYLGIVEPREAVDVAAEVAGRLRQVEVRVGDTVERGQVLATFDTRSLEDQLSIERASMERASAEARRMGLEARKALEEHERREGLGDLVSREEKESARFRSETAAVAHEGARAEMARAEARVEELRSRLGRSKIRAPFAGRVARRYLEAGAVAPAGASIVRLIGSGAVLARFAVPPDHAATVTVGSAIRVEVETPRQTFEGVVEKVAPEIDGASQMLFVEAQLNGGAGTGAVAGVPSGAVARVSLLSDVAAPATCRGVSLTTRGDGFELATGG